MSPWKVALCISVVWSSPVLATQYEVGSGQTYTTIQACINAMGAGDICNVHAGTYTERLTISSGTAGNLKTIQRNGSDSVIVTNTTAPVIILSNTKYFVLDGLDIRYTGSGVNAAVINDDYDGSVGVSTGWTIKNCLITLGGSPTGNGFGVTIADASNAEFIDNTITINTTTGGNDGADFLNVLNFTFARNTIAGVASTSGTMEDGLVTQGRNIVIENNNIHDGWCYDCHPDGIVIQSRASGQPDTDTVTIRGNTIQNFNQNIYIDCFTGPCTNINIYNNISTETSAYEYGAFTDATVCMVIDSEGVGAITATVYNNICDTLFLGIRWLTPMTGSSLVMKNNLIFNTPSNIDSTNATLNYNYYVMPSCGSDTAIDWGGVFYTFSGFVAATANEDNGLCTTSATLSLPANYIPDSNANTIERGEDLSGVFTTDKAGNTRSSPWDIGAYEFVDSGGGSSTGGSMDVRNRESDTILVSGR